MARQLPDNSSKWNIPENKLELIDGQLIISTLAGSQQVAWCLLNDYGPVVALPLALSELWWAALNQAFQPEPPLHTPEKWAEWAVHLDYNPELNRVGPVSLTEHQRIYRLLRDGLSHLAESSGLGRALGQDFVIRLGENGLTPDLIFVDGPRLANLHRYYLDGPPALAIEITHEGSSESDRQLKLELYEQAGLPEYWLIEPASRQITFYYLEADSRYHPVIADHWGRYPPGTNGQRRSLRLDREGVYRSEAVPGLALSVPHLWALTQQEEAEPGWPFLPIEQIITDTLPAHPPDPNELSWDSLPFAPRVALPPTSIQFDEYISWRPRAKFEYYGGGLKIGGSEGTQRVMGMLLMTFGLNEVVKLAHPFEWAIFLNRDAYQPLIQPRAEALLGQARYLPGEMRPGETYFQGEIPELPQLYAFGDNLIDCQQKLAEVVNNWLLLQLARRRELPK